MIATRTETAPASGGQNPVADILTDEQAGILLAVEPRTIRDWRTRRGLPFVRLTAKVVRIRRADLDKWISRHQVAITRGTP